MHLPVICAHGEPQGSSVPGVGKADMKMLIEDLRVTKLCKYRARTSSAGVHFTSKAQRRLDSLCHMMKTVALIMIGKISSYRPLVFVQLTAGRNRLSFARKNASL